MDPARTRYKLDSSAFFFRMPAQESDVFLACKNKSKPVTVAVSVDLQTEQTFISNTALGCVLVWVSLADLC